MATLATPALDALRGTFPGPARDIKANLGTVLASESLDDEQTWGVVLASAYYVGEAKLRDALVSDARAAKVRPEVFEDAQAAATLMAMNTVYYRFRHMVGKES